MEKRTNDPITLGSGKLYLTEYADTIPDFEAIKALCNKENRLAYIKGGAQLDYTETTYEEKDDLGMVSKIITTDEEVKLKCGLLTWTGKTLEKIIDRARVTEKDGVRTTRIGGAGNAKGKYYVVIFHHEDKEDGDLWVVIVGRNTAGLSLKFATNAGTVAEPEFTAKPHDEDGTLVILYEETGETAETAEGE